MDLNEPTNNILIITGAAPCVKEDINALALIIPPAIGCDWMAIGLDAADKYPWPIKYVATYHPVDLPEIFRRRKIIGGNIDFKVISHERRDNVDIFIGDWWKPSGSSTLLGVQAALRMGYRRIILCGCPLVGTNSVNGNYASFHKGWEPRVSELADRVRSMSGWTMDLLGRPTEEWLLGDKSGGAA